MMVTFISQCEKKAIAKTRRVLDAFANRIGDNTWQTLITEEGLATVRKMLRQSASKNTAVSCHWTRSRSRSQFLWVVGNRRKFNFDGTVAVNITRLNLKHKEWENGWERIELIELAAGIAGLFHDFGKANDLFQKKLSPNTDLKSEPFRHEWVSLRLFEAFVAGRLDQQWLTELHSIESLNHAEEIENRTIANIVRDDQHLTNPFNSFSEDAPFSKLVAWLIVSHHRLPLPTIKASKVDLKGQRNWLKVQFSCHWNSKNAENISDIENSIIDANWSFSHGTPITSTTWQVKAKELARRALSSNLLRNAQELLHQRFIAHISRLSLMLADHYYSSLEPDESKMKWQDDNYKVHANTDRATGQFKQQLDEHNIGVAHNAFLFARNLPALKHTLPAIGQHRLLSKNAEDVKYQWQDKAYKATKAFSKESEKLGFFGINMASTGCGKTIANARIMYALSDERDGCRFSVALGLRTLTMQTGDAYRALLKLGDDELAVLIGSNAVKLLHQLDKDEKKNTASANGSESIQDDYEHLFVSYEGQIYDGRLKRWLSSSPKLEQLVSAPVLVSTIDHLMPATESQRGGKQIAPMLRLLTSDLVLDEPDDFGLEDLPALCRIVNWAGMLGSRVLLSSATLPPGLIGALYDAYVAGRKHFNEVHFPHNNETGVVCAWYDEHNSEVALIRDEQTFTQACKRFTDKRLKTLVNNEDVLRKGQIVPTEAPPADTEDGTLGRDKDNERDQFIFKSVANTISQEIDRLHNAHYVKNEKGQRVSVGVVRMANINPMIEVAKNLLSMSPPDDTQFHFCVYHSQFPLALRSYKENRLDSILTRYDENAFWAQPEIAKALSDSSITNHVFVVLGTSVVEVGRDHDYDWAIAEPSSLRSIIQLAGRVQRHRKQSPTIPNIAVLDQNIRALKGERVAYCRPGFESPELPLSSRKLTDLISTEITNISAIPRMVEPTMTKRDFMKDPLSDNKSAANSVSSFVIQEHRAIRTALNVIGGDINHEQFYNSPKPASLWWDESSPIDWSAEFIDQTAFRKSEQQEEFTLQLSDTGELNWGQIDRTSLPYSFVKQNNRFTTESFSLAKGNCWWFDKSAQEIFHYFAEKMDGEIERVSQKLGVIGLRESKGDKPIHWAWHEQLGIYQGDY